MTSYRLPKRGLVDRNSPLSFTFDGRSMQGFEGDTLASALLASGEMLVGRSFKYHRPRGILTAGAAEPNALVTVGRCGRTEPNTRATVQELYEGLEAQSQNRWPSLDFDVGAGGKRLTAGQRQKLNLARALIRLSDFYIINQPLLALDQRTQDQITRNVFTFLHAEKRDPAIVWVLSNPALSELFDRVVHFENGRLVHEDAMEAPSKDSDYKELAS